MSDKYTSHDQAVTSALVVPEEAKKRLALFWKENSKQIAAVTAGTDTERIMKVTYSLLYRTPKLVECTPFSLLNGIVLAHQMGLVFGTSEVSLVPFGREATIIIGYQGKVKLALASKLITTVHCDSIIEGEDFEYWVTGAGVHFKHVPVWKARPRPSEDNSIGSYCQLQTSAGGVQTKFVPMSEVLDARERSRGYQYQKKQGKKDNPWFTDFGAMSMKTAIHRAMKTAPQDARLGLANSVDDEELGGSAVIAEGLNPAEFDAADLQQPLVDTGRGAQAAILEAKTGIQTVDNLPDPEPLVKGTRLQCGGKLFEVVATDDGHKFNEVK
jgi:recombination protein RecT